MRLPIYQVDAFTDRVFAGNPAAVCPLEAWLADATMQAIAAENNLAETAFFVREGSNYALRWFTPTVEVDLCGHATLASGHVVFSFLEPARQTVSFRTLKAGTLRVSRQADSLFTDVDGLVVSSRELVRRSQYGTLQTLNRMNATMDAMNAALGQLNSLMMSLETYPSHILYALPPEKEK